jgi:hypothetical protein
LAKEIAPSWRLPGTSFPSMNKIKVGRP